MGIAYKEAELQGTAAVGTYATLYDTSATNVTAIANILVTNTSASVRTVRIAVMGSAGTPSAANWRYFDVAIGANDSITVSPIAMQNGRYIRVSSSGTDVTFSASIAEFTP